MNAAKPESHNARAPSVSPQPAGLTPKQVMDFERLSRKEVYRRMQPGDPCYLIWRDRREVDGKAGRLIDPRSMTFSAQVRWRESLLRNAERPKAEPSPQLDLLPQTKLDSQIAALSLSRSERDVVLRRFRIIDLCLNSNWKAQGYPSKGEFLNSLAERNQTSKRNIQRWMLAWKQRENLLDLVAERPGPLPGTGTVLDSDMRAHLVGCWTFKKLTPRQCFRSLIGYLEGKQKSPGCQVDHFYPIPSRTTVERFIRSLSSIDHAARQGPDALKAACGHLDRTYTDLASLERVDTDEWKFDSFAYDDRHPKIVRRYWLLTFYDVRAIYPLVWEAVAGNEYEVRRGIAQEDEIELLVRLVLQYGIPGGLNSDRGRFRGQTFGGRPLYEKIDEIFAQANGILDQLGIRRNLPREHNPRGSRLERFHRYLADCCRTVPGWIGSNVRERKMAPGDAQRAEHDAFARGEQATTPLLSRSQLLEKTAEWMETWRVHDSEGTDMRGLPPRAVFVHNTPVEGFRRISEEELAWVTAQHFKNETIEPGGIITLPDGARYSHPLLAPMAGQRREVTRLRDDHSLIKVLPARKGQEAILARRRTRVGANDPEVLAREMEAQKRLRKLAASFTRPRTLEGALDREPAGQIAQAAREPLIAAEELDDLPQGIEFDGQIIQPRTFFED